MSADPGSLDRLHDLVVPPLVPFWPPAPGWYWLLVIAGIAAIWGMCIALMKWQRSACRREAMAEWQECDAMLAQPEKRREAIERLAALMKRVALSVHQREEVAALSEMQWGEFLGKSWGELGVNLERLSYAPELATSLDESELKSISGKVRNWITVFGKSEREEGDQSPC